MKHRLRFPVPQTGARRYDVLAENDALAAFLAAPTRTILASDGDVRDPGDAVEIGAGGLQARWADG